MKLYHGSMYLNEDGMLMSGFLRSGKLVKWDKTETNEWLYVIDNTEAVEGLGVASAIEKVFATKRYTEKGNDIRIECYNDGKIFTIDDISKLDVYIYEIEHNVHDGWEYVNNEHNGINDEMKTKKKITFDNFYKLDVTKWLKDKNVSIIQSKLESEELSLESFKPEESKEHPDWFKVKGYPSHLAHKDGRVKNASTGYETKGSADDCGYMRTSIWDNDSETKKDVKVHILVCTAFHGPKPKDNEVGHNDDVPGNNAATNLKWVTRLANMQKRHSMESSTFNW
jgi:hypothetical protein